jgi:hypothetical protein
MHVLGMSIFAVAMILACTVIVAMLAGNAARIAQALRGGSGMPQRAASARQIRPALARQVANDRGETRLSRAERLPLAA